MSSRFSIQIDNVEPTLSLLSRNLSKIKSHDRSCFMRNYLEAKGRDASSKFVSSDLPKDPRDKIWRFIQYGKRYSFLDTKNVNIQLDKRPYVCRITKLSYKLIWLSFYFIVTLYTLRATRIVSKKKKNLQCYKLSDQIKTLLLYIPTTLYSALSLTLTNSLIPTQRYSL